MMNPLAGGGRAKALIEGPDACCYTGLLKQQTTCFLDAMKQMNPKCPVKVELTTHAGHAIELAKKYTEEGWTVVGSGGDGSACEMIQGVLSASQNSDQPCGFVSSGSMNFFRCHFSRSRRMLCSFVFCVLSDALHF